MNLKLRLTLVSFFQFFVWGAWLITIATYFFSNGMGTGAQFGAIFSTLAISSLIMPALTGIIADRWMNAERLYGILHIVWGHTVLYSSGEGCGYFILCDSGCHALLHAYHFIVELDLLYHSEKRKF